MCDGGGAKVLIHLSCYYKDTRLANLSVNIMPIVHSGYLVCVFLINVLISDEGDKIFG